MGTMIAAVSPAFAVLLQKPRRACHARHDRQGQFLSVVHLRGRWPGHWHQAHWHETLHATNDKVEHFIQTDFGSGFSHKPIPPYTNPPSSGINSQTPIRSSSRTPLEAQQRRALFAYTFEFNYMIAGWRIPHRKHAKRRYDLNSLIGHRDRASRRRRILARTRPPDAKSAEGEQLPESFVA